MGIEDELADVRRMLREATERAQRAEMELELARRTARDLLERVSAKERLLRELSLEVRIGGMSPRLTAMARSAEELLDG